MESDLKNTEENKAENESGEQAPPSKQAHAETREKNQRKKKKKTRKHWAVWPIKALFLTFFLALAFSLISEVIIQSVSHAVSIALLLLGLIVFAIFFDIIALAVATCDPAPFNSLASRKVRGAKQSLALLKRAPMVTSILSDIIGDICGIVSGAAGVGLVVKLSIESDSFSFWPAILVSSIIAAVTVSGKAFSKYLSLKYSHKIVAATGKFIAVITFRK
jgi:hypothetical protein